jgi:hypothetical protein
MAEHKQKGCHAMLVATLISTHGAGGWVIPYVSSS